MTERNPAKATVKIDPELLRKAKQVVCLSPLDTGGKPVKLSEYLDSILRGTIERDHAKAIRNLRKQGGDE